MTRYFLYNKAKTRGNTLYITKNEIFKAKHINEQLKTINEIQDY